MSATGFALFQTAIGACGIAWGEAGLAGVQLPEENADAARARLARRFPQAIEQRPPPQVQAAIDAMTALIAGEARDLSSIPLNMERVPAFNRDIYDVARAIPPGATLSYGDIAARVGRPEAAREVGVAMGRNPFPIVVPCHRVLAAGGKIGGFSAHGGIAAKRKLLAIESVHAKGEADAPTLFDAM